MKLKYYLRGLGIGVAMTALILGVTLKTRPMSDAEVRARAAELGMVDTSSGLLSDLQESEEPSQADVPKEGSSEPTREEPTGETAPGNDLPAQESVPETGSPTQESVPEDAVPTGEPGAEESGSAGEPEPESNEHVKVYEAVKVTVGSGMDSGSVSRMLAEAGLVQDAAAFDLFLCDNGYSQFINTGTYEIEMGASEEEIARIITGKQ